MSATDRWSRPAAPKNPLAESAIAIGAAVFPCDENKYPLTKHVKCWGVEHAWQTEK